MATGELLGSVDGEGAGGRPGERSAGGRGKVWAGAECGRRGGPRLDRRSTFPAGRWQQLDWGPDGSFRPGAGTSEASQTSARSCSSSRICTGRTKGCSFRRCSQTGPVASFFVVGTARPGCSTGGRAGAEKLNSTTLALTRWPMPRRRKIIGEVTSRRCASRHTQALPSAPVEPPRDNSRLWAEQFDEDRPGRSGIIAARLDGLRREKRLIRTRRCSGRAGARRDSRSSTPGGWTCSALARAQRARKRRAALGRGRRGRYAFRHILVRTSPAAGSRMLRVHKARRRRVARTPRDRRPRQLVAMLRRSAGLGWLPGRR